MNKGSSIKLKVKFSLEWLLVGAIALSVVLRLLNLGSREFWYDEILSLLLSTGQKIAYHDPPDVPIALAEYTALLSIPDESNIRDTIATVANLLRGLVGSEPHPPLFFLSQHLWLRLFGNGEAAMRSLGGLMSTIAIAIAYGLGRVILGHRGGLLLAALLATNPFYLFHSLNLRMYGSLVLWTTLSAWALLQVCSKPFRASGVRNLEDGEESQVCSKPFRADSGRAEALTTNLEDDEQSQVCSKPFRADSGRAEALTTNLEDDEQSQVCSKPFRADSGRAEALTTNLEDAEESQVCSKPFRADSGRAEALTTNLEDDEQSQVCSKPFRADSGRAEALTTNLEDDEQSQVCSKPFRADSGRAEALTTNLEDDEQSQVCSKPFRASGMRNLEDGDEQSQVCSKPFRASGVSPLGLTTNLSGKLLHYIYNFTFNISPFIWDIILIGSVAAGCLTFYLFAYWVIALAAVVLYLDRQRWWQHGLRLGAGVAISIPWVLWGIPQQLRNADFERFEAPAGLLGVGMQHLHDVVQTLGIHLLLGDWVTSLPRAIALCSGIMAIALLSFCITSLWRQGERHVLGLAVIMGLFPLLLGILSDVATGKFTVGFGWGRSMILILPGCLLLVTIWIERSLPSLIQGNQNCRGGIGTQPLESTDNRSTKPARVKEIVAATLLLLYISISIGDFSLRQRQVFHKIAEAIAREPTTPTLIAINSKAWGHVMRLAYYIPATAQIMLLSQESAQIVPSLEKVVRLEAERYPRIVWLESAAPVWSAPTTKIERQKIERVLQTRFQLVEQQSLWGTMDLDKFTLNVYTRLPNR